ncbi:class A beta-lactamase [Tistrella mobilis]|uniref:class A beta-lactamase n=1 Tax=Tistrella mobilis TaxID=171437 RepID=UPI003557E2CD
MPTALPRLPRLPRLAGLALGLLLATPALAETPKTHMAETRLADTVSRIEDQLDARIGLVLHDTGRGWSWDHRADERFLMNSTVKMPICGAILAGVDAGRISLDETLPIRRADLLSYAPVTEPRAGTAMSIADLCFATLDQSDNTAANLLIARLGGPAAVTQFFRSIGDPVSRLDRLEPDLNSAPPGDPRDTTSPAAMAATMETLLLGHGLTPASRAQLTEWMRHGGVTGALLRKSAPADWQIADKSGAGDTTRNLVALITPPDRAPWIAAIYLADAETDFATRNKALAEIGAAVVAVIKGR